MPAYTTLGYADADGQLLNRKTKTGDIASNHFVAGLEFRPARTAVMTLEGFYKTYDHYPVSLIDSIALANKGTDYVAVGDEPVAPAGKGRYQLDVRADKSFYFRKWSLTFYADIQNIPL